MADALMVSGDGPANVIHVTRIADNGVELHGASGKAFMVYLSATRPDQPSSKLALEHLVSAT